MSAQITSRFESLRPGAIIVLFFGFVLLVHSIFVSLKFVFTLITIIGLAHVYFAWRNRSLDETGGVALLWIGVSIAAWDGRLLLLIGTMVVAIIGYLGLIAMVRSE